MSEQRVPGVSTEIPKTVGQQYAYLVRRSLIKSFKASCCSFHFLTLSRGIYFLRTIVISLPAVCTVAVKCSTTVEMMSVGCTYLFMTYFVRNVAPTKVSQKLQAMEKKKRKEFGAGPITKPIVCLWRRLFSCIPAVAPQIMVSMTATRHVQQMHQEVCTPYWIGNPLF